MCRSEYYGIKNKTPLYRRECSFGVKTVNINGAVGRRGGLGGGGGVKRLTQKCLGKIFLGLLIPG